MLPELQQILICRRDREKRAASALRQTRHQLDRAKADAEAAHACLAQHCLDKKKRQDKLYRCSFKTLLSKHEVDDLNIALDLMGEETNALVKQAQQADAVVEQQVKMAKEAALAYSRYRKAGDRWDYLVKDVASTEQYLRERAEDIAIEDDLGDRHNSNQVET